MKIISNDSNGFTHQRRFEIVKVKELPAELMPGSVVFFSRSRSIYPGSDY